jgi:hypothetical protein
MSHTHIIEQVTYKDLSTLEHTQIGRDEPRRSVGGGRDRDVEEEVEAAHDLVLFGRCNELKL